MNIIKKNFDYYRLLKKMMVFHRFILKAKFFIYLIFDISYIYYFGLNYYKMLICLMDFKFIIIINLFNKEYYI